MHSGEKFEKMETEGGVTGGHQKNRMGHSASRKDVFNKIQGNRFQQKQHENICN